MNTKTSRSQLTWQTRKYEDRQHSQFVAAARTQFVKALHRHAPWVVNELACEPLAVYRPLRLDAWARVGN